MRSPYLWLINVSYYFVLGGNVSLKASQMSAATLPAALGKSTPSIVRPIGEHGWRGPVPKNKEKIITFFFFFTSSFIYLSLKKSLISS
jgi:hypothetical protein